MVFFNVLLNVLSLFFSRWYLACDRLIQLSSLHNLPLCLIDFIMPCVIALFPWCLYLSKFCISIWQIFVFHLRQMIVWNIVVDVLQLGAGIRGSWYIIFKLRLFEIIASSLAINPLLDISFFVHAYRYFVAGADTKKIWMVVGYSGINYTRLRWYVVWRWSCKYIINQRATVFPSPCWECSFRE